MFFKKKTKKQLNNKSVVISTNFSILDKYESLTMRDCLRYEMVVQCFDKKFYKIIAETTEFGLIDVNIFDSENKNLTNVRAYGKIRETNGDVYFELDRIGNAKYKKMGFGHFMMQSIIYLLSQYEKIFNIEFDRIEGVLGIYGNDSPEESILFYKTFNNTKFNETKYLHLREETLNVEDRQILYLIA